MRTWQVGDLGVGRGMIGSNDGVTRPASAIKPSVTSQKQE